MACFASIQAVRLIKGIIFVSKHHFDIKPEDTLVLATNPDFCDNPNNPHELAGWVKNNIVEPNCGGENIKIINTSFIFLKTRNKKYQIILNLFINYLRALLRLFYGNWAPAFMLDEVAKLQYIENVDGKHLPRRILFPYTGTIHRPLWTFHAENLGADINLFFHGASMEPTFDGRVNDAAFLQFSQWPQNNSAERKHW